MYDIGRRVYCKSQDRVGVIAERGYGGSGRAQYLVELGPGQDFLTSSADLRAADFSCDGCGRWLPQGSSEGGPRDEDGALVAEFCFLCARGARSVRREVAEEVASLRRAGVDIER